MNHTDEQLDIFTAASVSSANLMIEALAGTGKTSTLEALVSHLPKKPILYLVFNKKNAEEATARMPSTVTVRTFNSMGHRIWAQTTGKSLKLDPKKSANILREIINETPKREQSVLWEVYWEVLSGVNLAKALGYLPQGKYPGIASLIGQGTLHSLLEEEPDDLVSDLIDTVLTRSIKLAFDGTTDYNDQVYMPALFRATCPEFPIVFVDEYQDLSPVNHALLKKLVRGRLIGVGDPNQNIYGFRGAKAGGMSEAIATYSMQSFPLSTSFRCPSEIVRHVQWHVPTFRAATEGGQVSLPPALPVGDIADNTTIICRNNAPLLSCAFGLLGAGRSINIAGSDIGPKLVATMRKLSRDGSSPKATVLSLIDNWEAEKLAKESKTAHDMAACMRIFANHASDLDGAVSYAEHLFKQTGRIFLSTIHKAKGLEWPNVIHLDPWLVRKHPSVANKNLDYVCSTRSSDALTEIDHLDIKW